MIRIGLRGGALGKLATASVAIAGTAMPAATTGASGHRSCFPAHSRTLLANREARVYASGIFEPTGGAAIYGCAYTHRRALALDDTDGVVAFPPPAISLAGPIIGYAVDICDAAQGTCDTGVFAEDLRLAGTPKQSVPLATHDASPEGRPVVKVGSLRVTRRGSLAWIVCPPHGDQTTGNLTADRSPNCVRPGDRDEVVALPAGTTTPTVLDRGNKINPSSLCLTRGRLTWTDGRKRRHTSFS